MQTQTTDLQFSRYADTGKVAYWYTQHFFGYLGRGATREGVNLSTAAHLLACPLTLYLYYTEWLLVPTWKTTGIIMKDSSLKWHPSLRPNPQRAARRLGMGRRDGCHFRQER